ncbi:MAG: ABC transporter ATP-binding protein [Acidimicrobiia bacterium]
MPESIISAEKLSHDYGSVLALDRLDVDIPPGVTGLVGANGAGKTTLIRILLGLLHPTAGTVRVLGSHVAEDPMGVRSRVGYMPEDECLPNDQTAADFVAYAASLAGLPPAAAKRRSSETLFLVGLHEERFRYLSDFSVGMRQRVKLAQAVVHDPELVLLDEPASGLDPEGRRQMLELIARLSDYGVNVLFSSHILTDIEETCDWVVMLDGGRLIRSAPLGDLGSSDGVHVRVTGRGERVAELLRARGADVAVEHDQLEVRTAAGDVYRLIRDAVAEAETGLLRLGTTPVTLEDVFLSEGADV